MKLESATKTEQYKHKYRNVNTEKKCKANNHILILWPTDGAFVSTFCASKHDMT